VILNGENVLWNVLFLPKFVCL